MYRVQFVMKGNDSYYVANGYMEIKDQDRSLEKALKTLLHVEQSVSESMRLHS